MAQALVGGLPPYHQLADGYSIRLTAIDPTTGNTVTGVTVSNVSIFVQSLTQTPPEDLATGPFVLVAGPQG